MDEKWKMETGFNTKNLSSGQPTCQSYLFRHVTGGLTTKWAAQIQLKHLRITAYFDFIHILGEWQLLQRTCGFCIKEPAEHSH